LAQVYGVVTFYSFFTMKPRGKHQVRVCLGTACHVRGGHQLEKKIEQELKIRPGEVDKDRLFSLDIVRCVGACGLAPVMVVDDDTHQQVKTARVEEILAGYRNREEEQCLNELHPLKHCRPFSKGGGRSSEIPAALDDLRQQRLPSHRQQ
jgi:(2Fe-2S) ferredoxin